MFCSKCGKSISENVNFCHSCGQAVPSLSKAEEQTATLNDVPIENTEPVYAIPVYATPVKPKNSKPLIIGIIAAACTIIIAVVAILASSLFGSISLRKQLLRDWQRVENSSSTYYTLKLDFDDNEIEYIFDGNYVDDEIATYRYEVVGKNKIKINGSKIITVEFNDEKTMMTFTPALTSTDSSENWFNF
ncbi:MAG: zinc ribbon domain-containing protein [Ruminococcaceae bacterium]|nr:zinc ribbon domain-containing protein [Oscillospiraceae bacterium]